MRSFFLISFLVFALAPLGLAHAQPAEYRRLSEAGAAASAAGHHQEAFALFAQAHAVFPNARSFRAMGASAFQLGHYTVAIENYQAALTDERRPLTPELRAQAEQELAVAQRLIGHATVSCTAVGATATIDGHAIPLGTEIAQDPGAHELVVAAPGFVERHQTFTTASADQQVFDVTLEPVGRADHVATDRVIDAPIESATTADVGFVVGGGTTLGLGIAFLIGGISAHAFGQSAIDSWNASVLMMGATCHADGNGHPVGTDPDSCKTLYNRWTDSQPWLFAGYIGGGVLSLAGVLLIVLAPQVHATPTTVGWTGCGSGPGDIGVGCGWQF